MPIPGAGPWWPLALILLAAATAPLRAEVTSETLFAHKHWKVDIVGFDDGSVACLAEVSAPGESFTLWAYPTRALRLQFYSTQWEFGENGDTANLEIQIDRRAPWTLTNAELYKNSVLFDIPPDDTGVRFLGEVARGNTLFLRSQAGENVQSYSLSGSSASMTALIECGDAIASTTPGNPFK